MLILYNLCLYLSLHCKIIKNLILSKVYNIIIVKIGLIGLGRIGQMHLGLLTQRVEGAICSTIYDPVSDLAKKISLKTGATIASSAQDLIHSPNVDAVAICSPTHTHIDLIIDSVLAGKPTFCEKPLALSLNQINRLEKVVETCKNPIVQIGFNRRFDTNHSDVAQRVHQGDIGDVHIVKITSRDPECPPLDYLKSGTGGIFLDMTIHDFDLARYITNSPVTRVFATGGIRIEPYFADFDDIDTAITLLTHKNGAITVIDNSRQAVYGYDQRVEVFGSKGMVSSDNPFITTTSFYSRSQISKSKLFYFFIERYTQSYITQWQAFINTVRNSTQPKVTIADGKAALVAGLSAWRSVKEKCQIECEEIAVNSSSETN